MAELSRHSRVPVATIKYYLREGLLPMATPTATTRDEFDQAHLRRLSSWIMHILAHVDDESVSPHDAEGQAAIREVDELIAGLGWTISPDAPARALLASALAALRRAGAPYGPGLHAYASVVAALAARDVPAVAPALHGKTRVELAEGALTAMVLHERVLIALHRLAQEDASTRLFDGSGAASDEIGQCAEFDWCYGCLAQG